MRSARRIATTAARAVSSCSNVDLNRIPAIIQRISVPSPSVNTPGCLSEFNATAIPRPAFPKRLCFLLRQSVVTCHPVWKDVVDPGRFNQTGASSKEQKWAALPEEICIDAIVNSNRNAGAIGTARGIFTSQIERIVTLWYQEP